MYNTKEVLIILSSYVVMFSNGHLKLACKPIFQKINTLCEKASIEVEGKHFDLDILIDGEMNFLQLVLGLGGSLCNYSCPWHRVHKNQKRADNMLLPW